MANTSNKNFPHAYGAGRCVAAFSLSHPGGSDQPDAEDSIPEMLPPYLKGLPVPPPPSETKSFIPYDPPVPGDRGKATLTFVPDVQPYNATSFGVYVTGSGTKSLPYRRAMAPDVPAFVSIPLNAQLPTTEMRPFGVVEDTQLGSTHGQVVLNCAQIEGVVPSDFREAWYEVALDWKVPPLRLTWDASGLPPGVGTYSTMDSNWVAAKAASIRNSVASTLWATATYANNAMSEVHPDTAPDVALSDYSNTGASSLFFNNYVTTAPAASGQYVEMPYGPTLGVTGSEFFEFSDTGFVEPFELRTNYQDMKALFPPTIRTDIVLKTTLNRWTLEDVNEDLDSFGPNFRGTLEMEFAPVVRIWVLWSNADGDAGEGIPKALNRYESRPMSGEEPPGYMVPCVNVQVWQKNSSAVDGTLKPVYDLYGEWGALGNDE